MSENRAPAPAGSTPAAPEAPAAPEPPAGDPVAAAVAVPDALPVVGADDDPPAGEQDPAPADEPDPAPADDADVPAIELPLALPQAATPPAPTTPAGNVNVSIRIFSPGDDGPVVQTGGGGATTPVPSNAVQPPATWIWNWTWTGAAGCDPGLGGNVAPPVGDWVWSWTWTCDGAEAAPAPLPDLGELPGVDVAFGSLAPDVAVPGLEQVTSVAGSVPVPALGPRADEPEPRSGRAGAQAHGERAVRSGRRDQPVPTALVAGTRAPGLVALPAAAAAQEPAAHRATARNRGRDTTRSRGAISPPEAPDSAPIAAAAASAAAATAGAGPAVLATLILLLISFLAGALLEVAGLPRLLLRAARLERPG